VRSSDLTLAEVHSCSGPEWVDGAALQRHSEVVMEDYAETIKVWVMRT
jgi:hypothetical protein